MRHGLTLVILIHLTIVSCVSQDINDIIKNYNVYASESFKSNYLGIKEFDVMNKREKCILEKTIIGYLNDENNWSTDVIDSFYVRSYPFGDFIDRFSFVSNNAGKFYFIYCPEFNGRLMNNKYYTKLKSGQLKLNESAGNYVVKLDMSLLSVFLNKEVTHSMSFDDQVTQVEHLLPSFFPHLLKDRTIPNLLIDSLSKRPKQQYLEIMKLIKPVIPSKDLVMNSGQQYYHVYRNVLGFVIVHFKKSANNPSKLELDFYLIPDQYRYTYYSHIDTKYRECAQID